MCWLHLMVSSSICKLGWYITTRNTRSRSITVDCCGRDCYGILHKSLNWFPSQAALFVGLYFNSFVFNARFPHLDQILSNIRAYLYKQQFYSILVGTILNMCMYILKLASCLKCKLVSTVLFSCTLKCLKQTYLDDQFSENFHWRMVFLQLLYEVHPNIGFCLFSSGKHIFICRNFVLLGECTCKSSVRNKHLTMQCTWLKW